MGPIYDEANNFLNLMEAAQQVYVISEISRKKYNLIKLCRDLGKIYFSFNLFAVICRISATCLLSYILYEPTDKFFSASESSYNDSVMFIK